METTNTTVSGFCQCSFKAPGLYTFTSPAFAKAQAIALCALGLSATQTVDWALEELLEHHKGQIIGPDRKLIDLNSDKPTDVAQFDNAFRDDTRRFVNHVKAKADVSWTGTYRLQKRMIYPMTLLWGALQIHDCRSSGKCSRKSQTS
tara:strand:+ start:5918 stop:6358 length:441 start_codon:yes stop_codon:yes gene_type:complete